MVLIYSYQKASYQLAFFVADGLVSEPAYFSDVAINFIMLI